MNSPLSYRPSFDGPTFNEARDTERLSAQWRSVYDALADGDWHTLADLSHKAGAPEASVSARIRDLRKPKFGGHVIVRRYVRRGLHEYRLAPK